MKAVKEMLDCYIDKGIVDTKRIYITGLSMGGMGTFDAFAVILTSLLLLLRFVEV